MHEDLHHVLLGVCWYRGCAARAVGGDVQWFIAVEQFQDVGRRWGVDDGGGNELVHSLVVGRVRGIMDEAGTARVDGTGEERHAD